MEDYKLLEQLFTEKESLMLFSALKLYQKHKTEHFQYGTAQIVDKLRKRVQRLRATIKKKYGGKQNGLHSRN